MRSDPGALSSVPSSGNKFLMRISNEQAWCEPEDAVDIDLTEEADIRYWTQALSCNRHELVNAIQAVGISVVDVDAHLKQRLSSGGSQ
jgi:ABC-type transport system involved in cytochrome c biogenesis ATPase subunit